MTFAYHSGSLGSAYLIFWHLHVLKNPSSLVIALLSYVEKWQLILVEIHSQATLIVIWTVLRYFTCNFIAL